MTRKDKRKENCDTSDQMRDVTLEVPLALRQLHREPEQQGYTRQLIFRLIEADELNFSLKVYLPHFINMNIITLQLLQNFHQGNS